MTAEDLLESVLSRLGDSFDAAAAVLDPRPPGGKIAATPPVNRADAIDALHVRLLGLDEVVEEMKAELDALIAGDTDVGDTDRDGDLLQEFFASLRTGEPPTTRGLAGKEVAELYAYSWEDRAFLDADTDDSLDWFDRSHRYYWRARETVEADINDADAEVVASANFAAGMGLLDEATRYEVFRERIAEAFHTIRLEENTGDPGSREFKTQNQALGLWLRAKRKAGDLGTWERGGTK